MPSRKSNFMKQADTAFSKYIRNRDQLCQARHDGRDCAGNLQCAHIISRSYKSIRTNEHNAIALCQGHHVFYTHRPLEWRQFVELNYPGLWDTLTEKALAYGRVDWKAEAAYWKAAV